MSKNKQKKRKGKTTANAKVRGNPNENDAQATSSQQCLSLMEDEITRCGQLATEGHPKPERCKVHHKQYRTLCRKYKEASEAVDNVKGDSQLPTQEQIGRYKSWHAALEKARWVRKYLEAIRVETAGREIHQKRFFLKVDDGHRRRLKLLEREMVRAVGVLDALQGRAYELYKPERTLCAINDRAPPKAETEWGRQAVRATVELLERIPNPDVFHESPPLMPPLTMPTTSSVGDEDLIDMSLRGQKEKMFVVLKPLMGFESFVDSVVGNTPPKTRGDKSLLEKRFFIHQQFARRIIFHQPTLFMKSLGRVSLKDLVLCDDFSMEDFSKFLGLLMNPMGFPLKWFKDAVLDALAISRHGTAANVGSVESRFSLLGGWVFNRSHTSSMSNEAWWFLLTMLDPPADVENRFVRLCNNFEDLVGFLSFEAFGLVPRPSFCESPSHFDPNDPGLSRNHLSLSGIIVADMISTALPPQMRGPLPTPQRARKRDCIVWAEVESRAYMFGAVRNERDGFVEAFMRELRARPDLFQVVLRSDTDPGRKVETFGLGPSNNGALPVVRVRQFEAPGSSPPSPPPSASDEWKVEWSAMDVLYGSQREMLGYLTILARDLKGWFFRFKTFPVTYFVIVDAVPSRDKSVLARNVSWAALRAGGYAEGEYTLRKYAAASDKLLEQCAQERLGWMSEEMKREIPMVKMQDQMGRTSWKARQQSRQTTVALDTDTDDGDSSNVVGDVQDGAELPTLEEIGQYTDRHAVLEKVSRVCDYLEAIRVEKSEREIHQKQVFLEVDDELLERKLVRAEDVLDALQRRADELYKPESTLHTTVALDPDPDDNYSPKVVDDVKGDAELPTQEEIDQYTDWHAVLEKVRWVYDYLEVIRVEREIHQKRSFPEADDELLERKVTRAEDVLDALQRRANELYRPEPTLDTTIDRAPPQAEAEWVKQSRRATAALDTDPEDKYDMDPTSLVLFAIELFDIRKDREEAFEYFVRAWHKAHQPFVTMKLVTHYLPLHIPLNMIDADEEQQLGTMSYYLECIGGPPGLAQLFLEAGLLHLEGATSVLSASSSTTSSIPIPPLPRPGEGGTQARNRDREMASRYFDRAKALHPGVDVPRIPDNDISQAALGNIHELEMPELEMPPIEIQPSALESVYSGEDSLCSKQQMLVHRRRKKKEELVLLDEVKEKEDIENAWHLDVPSLVGVGTALLVAGVIGALRLSWRRN